MCSILYDLVFSLVVFSLFLLPFVFVLGSVVSYFISLEIFDVTIQNKKLSELKPARGAHSCHITNIEPLAPLNSDSQFSCRL